MPEPPRIVIQAETCPHCQGKREVREPDLREGFDCLDCGGSGRLWPGWALRWWASYYGDLGLTEASEARLDAQSKEVSDG